MASKYQDYKNQYNKEHYKRIPLDIKTSEYEEWKQAAGRKPLNAFIKECVREYLHNIPRGDDRGDIS